MDKDKHYISNVEIFAPRYTCHEASWNIDNGGKQNFAPYEHPVVGAVGLFINGRILVCGGAIQKYEGCTGSGGTWGWNGRKGGHSMPEVRVQEGVPPQG